MPTDTTIIDRLRGLAEMMGTDGDAEAEASAIMLAAADALTAAHAARDAAEERARALMNDALLSECRKNERDALRRELTTALRERDEALAALARYQAEHERRRP